MQLAHPLHLLGQVATDFHDLAFNGIGQFGGSWPPLSPLRGTYGLGHGIPSGPMLTASSAHGCTVRNGCGTPPASVDES